MVRSLHDPVPNCIVCNKVLDDWERVVYVCRCLICVDAERK
jgi:hypothetical protein